MAVIIILALIFSIGFTQAMPMGKDRHLTANQAKDLNRMLVFHLNNFAELIKDKLAKSGLNKVPRISTPRPGVALYPFIIREDMKILKNKWKKFEWKGFGPAIPSKPFTPFDFRIIG